jgi:hypothetical protein
VDVGVARHPRADGGPALEVGGDRAEELGGGAQLAGHLPGEQVEHVLLRGEVLVERRPRATGLLGDPLDARLVVALVAEHLERGVEDPLLRPLPAGPHLGLVRERRAAGDGRGLAVGLPDAG